MAYAIPHELHGTPGWQLDSDRRLRISMLLAALIVAALLSVLRLPAAGESLPLTEIVVRLIERATEAVVEQTVVEERAAEMPPATEEKARVTSPTAPVESDAAEIDPVPLEAVDQDSELFPPLEILVIEDWHDFGTEVIREFIANLQKPVSANPVFDARRRQAAIRFRPSEAPVELHPWDKVEKDQIGRTILQLGGGCARVLDDPSAVYRDIFETYTQYIVECAITFGKRKPKELPWVADIRARYAYLRRWEAQKRDPYAFQY